MGKFQLAVSNFSDREELEDVGAVISGLSWPGLVQFFSSNTRKLHVIPLKKKNRSRCNPQTQNPTYSREQHKMGIVFVPHKNSMSILYRNMSGTGNKSVTKKLKH